MSTPFPRLLLLLSSMALSIASYSQIGIGTNTPDPNSILTIASTAKGVLLPRLSASQQTTLAASLGAGQKGMLITDATTGKLLGWTGTFFTDITNIAAEAPLSVSATNQVSLNPGTAAGDLLTWDGTNWVNMQPATQHFTFQLDNHQPYLVMNYCIALQGIFPSRSDAVPFLSQIQLFGFNFAPLGWAACNGQLMAIASNTALFSLLGTQFGGNGISTFGLPDLQGRVPIGMGQGPGLSPYSMGQEGGTETNTISR